MQDLIEDLKLTGQDHMNCIPYELSQKGLSDDKTSSENILNIVHTLN